MQVGIREDKGAGQDRLRRGARAAMGSRSIWPPYADYQRKTEREIPVVVLDPVR